MIISILIFVEVEIFGIKIQFVFGLRLGFIFYSM